MSETFNRGEQGEDFVMHKHIAFRHFSFFQAALSHNWKEFHEKQIAPRDCELVIFEGYLPWTHILEISFCDEPGSQPLELVKQWILEEFLGDDKFWNCVLAIQRSKHANDLPRSE